jgi:hypothetical protein
MTIEELLERSKTDKGMDVIGSESDHALAMSYCSSENLTRALFQSLA